MLVVPESINPGWTARTADGSALTPVTVNGWQQGWVVPPGTAGAVTLEFPSNTPYRAGLVGGLALLPLLALLAFLPVRSPRPCRRAGAAVAARARAAAARRGAGRRGSIVRGRRRRRGRRGARRALSAAGPARKLCDGVTLGVTAGGLILAGAVLSQNPWRSVDGYVGHSGGCSCWR